MRISVKRDACLLNVVADDCVPDRAFGTEKPIHHLSLIFLLFLRQVLIIQKQSRVCVGLA
jgi:hypothetical protein